MSAVKITLTRALKEKNRVAKKVNDLQKKLQTNNSIIAGNERQYDVNTLMSDLRGEITKLVQIKDAIQAANGPIQKYILRIGETKSLIKFLRKLDTKQGVVNDRYGRSEPMTYDTVLTQRNVDDLIVELEKEIDTQVDAIEAHNSRTEVEIVL